jgi:polar amino acid transport system permease protein
MHALFDPTLFWEYRVILLRGLGINLLVFALSLGLGLVLGVLACASRLASHRAVSRAGAVWIELWRAAPEFVTLMWIHTVLPPLLSGLTGQRVTFPAILSAVLALGLGASAYFAESFRAGIQAIPRGQLDAAAAIGMSRVAAFRRITLPQAIRRMLPELTSQGIGLLKTTTLVSVITVPDVMYQVGLINQQEMRPLPLYTDAALLFFGLIAALVWLSPARLRPVES